MEENQLDSTEREVSLSNEIQPEMKSTMCLKVSFTVELSNWTFTMQISLEFKATVCNFLMRFYRDPFWHKISTFKFKSVLFTFQMFLSMKKFSRLFLDIYLYSNALLVQE